MAKQREKTTSARGSAASKNAGAGKRGAQPKAGRRGATPAPKAERGSASTQRSQTSRSRTGTKPEVAIEESKDMVIVTLKYHGDKNGGHNHVIIEDIDENHVSVGLTTRKKKGKNHPNYALEQSPLGDGKKSYMRRQGTVAPKKEYKSPQKGEMTSKDYAKAKEIGNKAKKKYLEKKQQKK